jgi:hypothetical protein
MMRHRTRSLLIGALGTALVTVALTPVAVAQESPVITASLTGHATLVAKGAAVDVEVLYSCSSEVPESISVATINVFDVTQRVRGGHLATGSGSGSDSLVCDGAEHVAVDRVIADGDLAFKKGEAVARGSATICDTSACTFSSFSGTVRIR